MWQLMMTNATRQWVEAGLFESVTAAAAEIRRFEEYPVKGLFLEIHVETEHGTDAEAFGHLEHTGLHALYVVKRRTN